MHTAELSKNRCRPYERSYIPDKETNTGINIFHGRLKVESGFSHTKTPLRRLETP